MKKVLSLILVIALTAILLAGCGESGDGKYTVGVCQLVQHEALDAATNGFTDALKEKLGDKVTFDIQNASGESVNCATIINGFTSKGVDLILANATSPLQAAASATTTIPILGTSITDYASALEIDNWSGKTGRNISGTSDLAPLDVQSAMFKEWFPDAKKVGLLYCSAEANSAFQVKVVSEQLAALGFEVREFSFTDTNDVATVTQAACDWADALYVPTDNTAASNTEAIANIVLPAKKPTITGESGMCKGFGVATLSIDYYDLGYTTGLMAAQILTGEAKVEDMEIKFAPKTTKLFNKTVCDQLGLSVPSDEYEEIK